MSREWCAGLGAEQPALCGAKVLVLDFADFLGLNIPITADFKLPM